jgi:hypothetical protein
MDNEQQAEEPAAGEEAKAAGRLTCFVVGPIGNRHAKAGSDERREYEEALQVLEEVILPACEAVGLEPVRADGLARAGEITDQVFRRLRDDDVVIADLTGANANVMYELGLRHTRNKLTLQVGEYGRLPFDVNVIRTVMFSRSAHGLISARNELIPMLEAGLLGQFDPVTATRVWNEEPGALMPIEEADERESEAAAEEGETEEAGFIDLLAASEDGMDGVVAAGESMTQAMDRLGQLANASAAEVATSDAQGRGMKGRLAILIKYASGMGEVAEELERASADYVKAMNDVSAGNLALIERLEEEPSLLDEGMQWAQMTRRLSESSREMVASLGDFVESMKENAKLSRVLREPTNRIVSAFGAIAATTAAADEWDRRLQALGVPMPAEDWEPEFDEPAGSDGGEPDATDAVPDDSDEP